MPLSMLDMSPVELVVVEGISPANDACRVTPRDGASGSTPVRMTTKDETVFRLSTCTGRCLFRLSSGRLERTRLVQAGYTSALGGWGRCLSHDFL